MCSSFCWFVCEAFLCVHVLAGRVVVVFCCSGFVVGLPLSSWIRVRVRVR